jgi:hypothetical protein
MSTLPPDVPQPILDAITAVQTDFDSLAALQATAAASAAASIAAQAQAASDAAAVVTANTHLQADLQALIALEQSTWGTPPAPAKK